MIIFFVLSGFVIAYVAGERENSLKSYAIARAVKNFSVCLLICHLRIGAFMT